MKRLLYILGLCVMFCGFAGAQAATPVALLQSITDLTALTTDGTYLYFGSVENGAGALNRMNLDGTNRRTLVLPSGGEVNDITFDGNTIYFSHCPLRWPSCNNGVYTVQVDSVSKDFLGTSVPTPLVAPLGGGMLDVVGNNIYWGRDFCCIDRMPLPSGPVETVVPGGVWERQHVRDGAFIFHTSYFGPSYRLNTVTREELEVMPSLSGTGDSNIFIDSTNFYRTPTLVYGVYKTPKNVSAPVPPPTLIPGSEGVTAFASDGTSVYGSLNGDLVSVPIAGGTPIHLVSPASVHHIVYAAGSIFWNTVDGATLYRLSVTPTQVACPNAPMNLITVDQSRDYPNLATGGLYGVSISNNRVEPLTGALLVDVALSPNPITSSIAFGIYARVLTDGIPFPLQLCYFENEPGCVAWGSPSAGVATVLTNKVSGDFISPERFPTYTIRWCQSGSQSFVAGRTLKATEYLLYSALQKALTGIFPQAEVVSDVVEISKFWDAINASPDIVILMSDLRKVLNSSLSTKDRLASAAKLQLDFRQVYANFGDSFFEALYTYVVKLPSVPGSATSKLTFLNVVGRTLDALDLANLALAAGFLDVNVGLPPIITIYAQ